MVIAVPTAIDLVISSNNDSNATLISRSTIARLASRGVSIIIWALLRASLFA